MMGEGKNYAEIRRTLDDMGGITWSQSRLKYLLTNVVYKGDYYSHMEITAIRYIRLWRRPSNRTL